MYWMRDVGMGSEKKGVTRGRQRNELRYCIQLKGNFILEKRANIM